VTSESEPITLAICSNRPHLLSDVIATTIDAARPTDSISVVVDGSSWKDADRWSPTVNICVNSTNRGLAYSRNRVLKECRTRFVVFLDDDIAATRHAVESARVALTEGADVVGARITADMQGRRMPWYLSTGQLHYLGSHNPDVPATIWGGFLGVDIERARLLGVEFDERLGRTGTTLGSAEDTTFVRTVAARGGRTELLPGVEVRHLIPAARLRLTYLLRRAYWQGRSEYRRRDAGNGLAKEIVRNWRADGLILRRAALAVMFSGAVAVGILCEAVLHPGRRRCASRPPTRTSWRGVTR
jgi:glycosyltransferase involved in cell wall biosynthesis